MIDIHTLDYTMHAEIRPGRLIIELANEPGVYWEVTAIRPTPALSVWKRLTTWTSPTGETLQPAEA